VWATLHDPAATGLLFPELQLGPAAPAWPAAATTRPAQARLGLLRDTARVESLEARPEARFRVRVTASGFDSEWSWRMEPVAGGTRVIHAATFEPFDRWTGILVRLGRATLASRVEAHLRELKDRAEAAQRWIRPPERWSGAPVDPRGGSDPVLSLSLRQMIVVGPRGHATRRSPHEERSTRLCITGCREIGRVTAPSAGPHACPDIRIVRR
jgi:hypothetical protein